MALLLSALLVVDDVVGNLFGEHDCNKLVSQALLVSTRDVKDQTYKQGQEADRGAGKGMPKDQRLGLKRSRQISQPFSPGHRKEGKKIKDGDLPLSNPMMEPRLFTTAFSSSSRPMRRVAAG